MTESPAQDAPILPPFPRPEDTARPPPAPTGTVPVVTKLLTGPGGRLVKTAGLFYGLVLVFAIGYAISGGTAGRLFGDAAPTGNGILLGVFLGAVIVAACQFGVRTLPSVARAANEISRLVGPLSYGAVAALAFMSAFAEELLFRGALWPHLGLWGTTFLFGLVHVVWRRPLLGYPLFALVAGLLFGLVRAGTENVIPCILAHGTVNAANLGWLEWARRRASVLAAAPVPSPPQA